MSYHTSSSHFPGEFMSGSRPHIKILFAFFLMFITYLFVTLASMLLALPLYSLSWAELSVILSSGIMQADISLLKYFQVAQTLGLFLLPAILMNYLLFSGSDRYLPVEKKTRQPYLVLFIVLLSLLVSIPLVSTLIEWNSSIRFPEWASGLEDSIKKMEEERTRLTARMLDGRSIQDLAINIFIIAIMPALSEEFLFRGVLQTLLAKWLRNSHIALVVSAFLFSAIHLQFYGFFPRMLLGIYFGYLFLWSRNIWWPVVAHFINNAFAIVLLFLQDARNMVLPDILTEEHHSGTAEFMICLSLTVVFISLLWNFYRRKGNNPA